MLALTPDAVTAASIQPVGSLPGLARPAGASDQALLSLATNVRWALVGNPLSGASVSFDPNSGQFTVSGNFAMNVSYEFFGNPNSGSSFNTTYVAYLFWKGKSRAVNLASVRETVVDTPKRGGPIRHTTMGQTYAFGVRT